jgi:hypothetical protein
MPVGVKILNSSLNTDYLVIFTDYLVYNTLQKK